MLAGIEQVVRDLERDTDPVAEAPQAPEVVLGSSGEDGATRHRRGDQRRRLARVDRLDPLRVAGRVTLERFREGGMLDEKGVGASPKSH